MTERDGEQPTPSEADVRCPQSKSGRGYGQPPIHSRFPPGQSGNPKGRPKGARGWEQIVRRIALETHTFTQDGKRQKRTTLVLVLLSLRNLAVSGNVRAFRAIHELLQRYAPQQPVKRGGYLIVPEPASVEEWIRRVEKNQRKGRGESEEDGTVQ